MASYIAAADSALNTGSTWHLVDATSLLDSEAGNTELTTSYVSSSVFTPGAIEVDGVAVKIANVAASGAYTMSVQLYNSTDSVAVAGTEVTINLTDLPVNATTTNNMGGWAFFLFGSPVTLEAAHNYTVQAKESNAAANINLYRDATANNWSRMLRTTTDAASPPAAASILHIMEEKTGAGAATARTVTMDALATSITKYGSGTDASACITISDGGALNYGYTAATNYYLQLDGNLIVYSGGTFTVGTVANPIPRDGTAVLEFDPTADGGMGLIIRDGGIFTSQGLSRTINKNVVSCKLNTDEAVNSTSLGVDTDTGWLDNDVIIVASTTRTVANSEQGTLNGNANAADLTVDGFGGAGGGLANAHLGTVPRLAEVILLTRNVIIRSSSSTVMTYIYIATIATIDIDWTEFYYLGENVANKRGIEIATTTGSCNIQYSSMHNFEDWGIYPVGSAHNNITFSNNILYELNTAAGGTYPLNPIVTSGTSITYNNNIFIQSATGNQSIYIQDLGITFTNNTLVGLNILIAGASDLMTGTISGNIVHSSNGFGLNLGSNLFTDTSNGLTIGTLTIWRCNSGGIKICNASSGTNNTGITFNTGTLFGNGTNNISFENGTIAINIVFNNYAVDSDLAGFTTTSGIKVVNVSGVFIALFNTCTFGTTVVHDTQDILMSSSNFLQQLTFINCSFGTGTEFGNITFSTGEYSSFVRSHKHDQSATDFRSYYRLGTIFSETTTRHTASGYSWKMTPNTANWKLILPGPTRLDTFKAAVNANTAVTVTIWVLKDSSYNGNAPRLVLVGGIIAGIASDVIDSLTVGADTWEQLSVSGTPTETGVVDYYIDCDGTAGSIYVDDISVSQA